MSKVDNVIRSPKWDLRYGNTNKKASIIYSLNKGIQSDEEIAEAHGVEVEEVVRVRAEAREEGEARAA